MGRICESTINLLHWHTLILFVDLVFTVDDSQEVGGGLYGVVQRGSVSVVMRFEIHGTIGKGI